MNVKRSSLRRLMLHRQVAGQADVWTQGCGCVQVCAAYDYLTQHWQCPDEHIPLIVKCGVNQGIIIREQGDLAPIIVRDVNITPFFPPNSPPDATCKFSLHLNMSSTAPWLTAPRHLALMCVGTHRSRNSRARPHVVQVQRPRFQVGNSHVVPSSWSALCVHHRHCSTARAAFAFFSNFISREFITSQGFAVLTAVIYATFLRPFL
jgi:hypothetical protein